MLNTRKSKTEREIRLESPLESHEARPYQSIMFVMKRMTTYLFAYSLTEMVVRISQPVSSKAITVPLFGKTN
jgi:hypothetical protein